MKLTSEVINRRSVVGLIVVAIACLLLFSAFGKVESAVQSQRTIENKIPEYVPLRIKFKKDKEEKIKNNKEWYRDFEMDITNTGDKPIYFFSLFIQMPGVTGADGGVMVFNVFFGRTDFVDANVRPDRDDKPLMPKETYTFTIPSKNQIAWEAWQKRNNKYDVPKLEIWFNHLSFGDGTGFMSLGAIPFPVKQQPEELARCLQKSSPAEQWAINPRPASGLFATVFETPAAFAPVNLSSEEYVTSTLSMPPDICCPSTSCNKFKNIIYTCVCDNENSNAHSVATTACSDPAGACGTLTPMNSACSFEGVDCPQTGYTPCVTPPSPTPTPTPCPATFPSACSSGIAKDVCSEPLIDGCPPFMHAEGACCVMDSCNYPTLNCNLGQTKIQSGPPICFQFCVDIPSLPEEVCAEFGFFFSIAGGCRESVPIEPEDCQDWFWFWNYQFSGCHEEEQTCSGHCSPYWPLESGGCELALDYCAFQYGCPFGLTDGGSGCCCGPTPILIDVAGNGFQLTDAYGGVHFDMGGDGHSEPIAWTTSGTDDAWLVLDRNGNGTIDSAKEMFGNFTEQPVTTPPNGFPPNGFLALAEFDKPEKGGNRDGRIRNNDAVFASLRLWQDVNSNGVSEPSELHPLSELGLSTLELKFKESKKTDQYGNKFRYRAKVKGENSQISRWAWDVVLGVNPDPRGKPKK